MGCTLAVVVEEQGVLTGQNDSASVILNRGYVWECRCVVWPAS